VVVHALHREPTDSPAGSLVGFVVTKAVGNAVHRNRVRRRLRHLAAPRLAGLGDGTLVVVRALPPAADADADLARDLDSAWTAALTKLGPR
jgi:ribonuclease P protein component